ncbi:hypothetical protein FGADI_9149 [Fusarium gaditjirri]|uniref:Uncharacterized protein n=1 Tax=Fusarium gaditjirri TaxID=282569 RepID=A0A8H4T0G1_9HYPO|nr:hypothetical protein FGADI_9149 [Fusarium gaditjirri]
MPTTATFYKIDGAMVNWLRSIFLFPDFAIILIAINFLCWGPHPSLIGDSAFLLVSNSTHYTGSYSSSGLLVAQAQALFRISQFAVLSAPTRFTVRGRRSAAAVTSLAEPTWFHSGRMNPVISRLAFVPSAKELGALYTVLGYIGILSLALVPIVLES